MSPRRTSESPEPPYWWNLELYDFLSDLPVQGWIWEFMRRAKLKEILKGSPVDAMNPEPELEGLDPDLWDLYDCYQTILRQGRHPVFFPPSVRIRGKRPKGYRHQQFSVGDEDLNYLESLDLWIDLNRPDSVNIRDFESILLELKLEHKNELSEPCGKSPRPKTWLHNRTILIWDLHQYGVYYERIADIVLDENDEGGIEKIYNASKVTKKYIDKGKWIYLARYVESE
jgi:hypothetical protein